MSDVILSYRRRLKNSIANINLRIAQEKDPIIKDHLRRSVETIRDELSSYDRSRRMQEDAYATHKPQTTMQSLREVIDASRKSIRNRKTDRK